MYLTKGGYVMINAPKIESLKIYELFILLETRKFNILESTKPYLVSRED